MIWAEMAKNSSVRIDACKCGIKPILVSKWKYIDQADKRVLHSDKVMTVAYDWDHIHGRGMCGFLPLENAQCEEFHWCHFAIASREAA